MAGMASVSSRTARPSRRARRGTSLARRLRRWRKGAARALRLFRAAPRALQIAAAAAVVLVLFATANLVYQVARKPTEMFFPVSGALAKMPAATWRDYAPLFRAYSTAAVSPELLAALAQVEGAGNPVARTYWRWRFSWNPFAVYKPASSAVGMYQMTDGAFDEARRYCIRHHAVEEGCWSDAFYTRVVPGDAVELTAVYLDHHVAAILERLPKARPTPQQKQDLAALVHLCGAGPAEAYARRGFRLARGERCGDHDPAVYLAEVHAMEHLFRRLSAER